MANMTLDEKDLAAMRALDSEVEFNSDSTIATFVGDIRITVVRPDPEKFKMEITFSNGEQFKILMLRSKTFEELGVGESES